MFSVWMSFVKLMFTLKGGSVTALVPSVLYFPCLHPSDDQLIGVPINSWDRDHKSLEPPPVRGEWVLVVATHSFSLLVLF